MRRKLFTIGAGISLLLLIATVTLGVRGYFRGDDLHYQRLTHSSGGWGHLYWLDFQSSRGRLGLNGARLNVLTDEAWNPLRDVYAQRLHYVGYEPIDLKVGDDRLGGVAGRIGFGLETYSGYSRKPINPFGYARAISILFPAWFLALLFSLLPALRLRRWILDRQRNRPGFCRTCGYDLRATPERCPECGMEVPAPAPPVV
ncbi:MAG TPA: hypothetical protein VIL86_17025 [Tepidisphaeraceae bacterium]